MAAGGGLAGEGVHGDARARRVDSLGRGAQLGLAVVDHAGHAVDGRGEVRREVVEDHLHPGRVLIAGAPRGVLRELARGWSPPGCR